MSENGQKGSGTLIASRLQRVESGLTAFQELAADAEAKQRKVDELTINLARMLTENEALQLAHSRALSEMESYRSERDKAVERRAEVETVLEAMYTMMQRFQGPATGAASENRK